MCGTETAKNWYSDIPKSITENDDMTVLWNQGVQTHREGLANKSDVTVKTRTEPAY
jgi:hypothetical protein